MKAGIVIFPGTNRERDMAIALRQTVVAWAQAHSEDSKLPAAMLVVHAFRASFPCKGGTPAGSAGVR